MSTISEAVNDKRELEAQIMKMIDEFHLKHPGLLIQGISVNTTTVSSYPPVQRIEVGIRLIN